MYVLVTGGGLRWIRYCFINEQQAGTVSYRAVSICKPGAKRTSVCMGVCACLCVCMHVYVYVCLYVCMFIHVDAV